MPRYIDAEALMQKFCKQCGVKDREYFCHAHCGDRMIIESIPTADVQSVKHGRWIVTKTERGWNCAEYPVEWTCSECNVANDRKDDFCPHCGSYNRMDGDGQ